MCKKYFVWKDADCNGKNIEWIEMSGNEFCKFMRLPENRNRRIIRLEDIFYESDTIYIEVTEQDFKAWEKEQNHADYLHEQEKEACILSLNQLVSDDTQDEFISLIPDSYNFIDEFEKKEIVKSFFSYACELPADEQKIVRGIYEGFSDNLSEQEIAARLEMNPRTYRDKKCRIFAKFRKSSAAF